MRPTKLTAELAKQIAGLISAGHYGEVAAQMSGISERTYYDWLARGAAALKAAEASGEDVPASEAPFASFASGVYVAKGLAEARFLKVVTDAALDEETPNLQAAQWLLERTRPERFGRRDTVKVEQAVERELAAALDKLQRGLTPDEFARVLEVLSEDDDADAAGVGARAAGAATAVRH